MPMEEEKDEIMKDILNKYRNKLNSELGAPNAEPQDMQVITSEYGEFKKELLPKTMTMYEKACNFSEKLFKIAPDKKKLAQLQESINISHLEITPTGVYSFSLLAPLAIILGGLLLSMGIPALLGLEMSTFFILFFLGIGVAVMFALQMYPNMLANTWRLNASNQMVLCVFYVVTYMRHTSNLERAIKFSADHLSGPLALDLRKVLWDVEMEKYSSIKESLDNYLESWRKWNMEFIESFHLIESSLFESSDARRLSMLDKSLDVMLDETYEKMLHYAQNLKGPITTLHMLGIILPILGLVILPLVVSFMGGVHWYHIAAMYNVLLPLSVYYLGKNILSKRPTGYGDTDISDEHPELKKLKNINFKLLGQEISITPMYLAITLGVLLSFIGTLPLILQFIGFPDIGFGPDDTTTGCMFKYCVLDYRSPPDSTDLIGPFSLIASVLSFCFPLAIAFSVGLYHKIRSSDVIKVREKSKELEKEFASGLFQLGNRLGDGIPVEIAFSKVAGVMGDSTTGKFFALVSNNISQLGMSVDQALFDPKSGAVSQYPSKMIESSMKVLTESSRKGPKIAAQALVNISRYVKEMHRVDERLKDLLADIISSMKAQISMMTPAIAGIVIGITSMITNILGKLGPMLSAQNAGVDGGMPTEMFGLGIPTYFFQAVVGVYVAQLVYVLTIMSNGIENGSDTLNERFLIGRNLTKSVLIYTVIAMIIMVLFNIVASAVLDGVLSANL